MRDFKKTELRRLLLEAWEQNARMDESSVDGIVMSWDVFRQLCAVAGIKHTDLTDEPASTKGANFPW